MKFLEYPPLQKLNGFLDNLNVGDYFIQGVIEAYSCKLAGIDKKLSRSLDQEVMDSLGASGTSPLISCSPVGPLTESASRKTLIYLILTLNHMYPDYDFSTLRAHHFTKEASIAGVKQKLNDSLMEASKVWAATEGDDSSSLLEMLWSVIDEVIELVDTDVYSYKSDLLEGDPFGETGNLWSFNYFFYNRKLKRILYFSCKSVSKTALDKSSTGSEANDYDVGDMDFASEMDMA